jgi:hypothetical protein
MQYLLCHINGCLRQADILNILGSRLGWQQIFQNTHVGLIVFCKRSLHCTRVLFIILFITRVLAWLTVSPTLFLHSGVFGNGHLSSRATFLHPSTNVSHFLATRPHSRHLSIQQSANILWNRSTLLKLEKNFYQ